MSAVAKIAKPNMRGMHVQAIKKNLIIATVVSSNSGYTSTVQCTVGVYSVQW